MDEPVIITTDTYEDMTPDPELEALARKMGLVD